MQDASVLFPLRYMRSEYANAFSVLLSRANLYGINVTTAIDCEDLYIPGSGSEPSLIQLCIRGTALAAICTFLHELGHHVAYNNARNRQQHPALMSGYSAWWYKSAGRNNRTNLTSIIVDEVMAWDAGWDIACQLNINVPLRSWIRIRNKSLHSYFVGYSDRYVDK